MSVQRIAAIAIVLCAASGAARAGVEAQLLVDADSGKVLHAENAGYPWYPASITKLMTTYATLRAVREGRLTLDTPLTVSAVAASQAPSKMGFKPGTEITVDNALKLLLVKSANDMAVVLAEGVSGSIDEFSEEMNRAARRLGMTQTSYVNPNGLPADGQISSARDLAILARALIREFPEYDSYWHIPAIRFGKRLIRNYNSLIDRYPGADGMKTGFICASGFNLVASATRDGRRLIAVILGAPSGPVRAVKAAQLLERGFSAPSLSWLTPSLGTVDALAPIAAAPVNLRDEMCGKHRRRPAAEEADDDDEIASGSDSGTEVALSLTNTRAPHVRGVDLLAPGGGTPSRIVNVFLGAPKKQAATQLAAAGSAAAKLPPPRPAQILPEPMPLQPQVQPPMQPQALPARPAVVTAGAIPWSSFSPAALAATPPPLLAVVSGDPVPMPRPRPGR